MATMTAMIVHFPLSAVFGLRAVHAINLYPIAPMVFPWFAEARNWISVLAHAIFGVVPAGAYVCLMER